MKGISNLERFLHISLQMLSVRRQLTRILLEVTNDEMHVVAQEALERARAKQKGTFRIRPLISTLIIPNQLNLSLCKQRLSSQSMKENIEIGKVSFQLDAESFLGVRLFFISSSMVATVVILLNLFF